MKRNPKESRKRSFLLSMLSNATLHRNTRQSAVAFTPTFRRVESMLTNTHRRSSHDTFFSGQNNENAPDLILPSHPGTPITTVMA